MSEWQNLCDEFHGAWDEHQKALFIVSRKFSTIDTPSHRNPTEEELIAEENAWQTLTSIRQRMDEFIKQNT